MLLLAIDTTAPRVQLALLSDAKLPLCSVDDLATGHAEILFDRIGALLARGQVGYRALERIAVTTGPGSFTGVRIGLSAARGLGLALRIPVLGIPTLLALSLCAPAEQAVRVVLDARRAEGYVQDFAAPGLPMGAPRLLPIEEARILGDVIEPRFVDIAAVAVFAAGQEPARFPPEPTYVRMADAKPQGKARIARAGKGA